MASATMSIRVDAETKRAVESFCADVGMTPSAAVNIFFKAMLRENRIPFEITRDPFYSESNMAYLRRGLEQLNSGQGKEHDLIED